MKWLYRLICVSDTLSVAAVVAPIAWYVVVLDAIILEGLSESDPLVRVFASTPVAYGMVGVPFLAAPALVVLGVALAVGAYLLAKKQSVARLAARAKLSLLVHVLCGLAWLATCGVFGSFPD